MKIGKDASNIFNRVWRFDFCAPGFCLVELGVSVDSHALRSAMVTAFGTEDLSLAQQARDQRFKAAGGPTAQNVAVQERRLADALKAEADALLKAPLTPPAAVTRRTHAAAESAAILERPEQSVGIKQEAQALRPPGGLRRSNGASKSSGYSNSPFAVPSFRRAGLPQAIRRARGRPALAIIISSPAAASSTRRERWVLAA